MKTSAPPVSRRRFLALSGTAFAAPFIIPASALGKAGSVAPSNRLTLALIGCGGRGNYVMSHFMAHRDVQFLAVCDVRAQNRDKSKEQVDRQYANQDCGAYNDFRDVLARKDIDAVLIATGDRWHALTSILAAKAGKDIYCEKPMSLTVAEGRAITDTMKRLGIIWQCGHQRRSVDSYRFVKEVVQRGLIGRVRKVTATNFSGHQGPIEQPQAVPKGFDYDLWLGPCPWMPYSPQRVGHWNYIWDTAGGSLCGMGTHLVDFAQWVLQTELTAPVEYEGEAVWPKDGVCDCPITYTATCKYRDGTELIIRAEGGFTDRWTRFEGEEGWISLHDHTNEIQAQPASILDLRGVTKLDWSHTGDHTRNFLDCVKNRTQPISPPENSHRSTSICHVANISLRLGRKVVWNPEKERFVNDVEADKMLSRAMRAPWRL